MLDTLRIQNFKSWKDTGNIHFSSLTGFFGTNSSGKSSILQFLLMLKQTVESSDRSRILHTGDEKSYVDLGTLYDILHMHEDPGFLEFSFEWRDDNGISEWSGELKVEAPTERFSATISIDSDKIALHSFSYGTRDRRFILNNDEPTILANPPFSLTIEKGPSNSIEKVPGKFHNPSNFFGIPNNVYINYPSIEDQLQRTEESFYHLFETIHYLGPLREYPRRTYSWAGSRPEGVGDRGEDAVAALLASRQLGPTIIISHTEPKRTVEEHVAYWLKELGMIHSFIVQPIAPNRKEYEVRIQRTAESASVFLTDVGFGVSQILPVLVLLFYVPEGSTVILEQPEIHLHPAVQAGLADVFIDAIKRRHIQIILESHSEHLLQRLQRRMAEFGLEKEKGFDADNAALYFTDIAAGQSKLTPLALDDYGNISNWPTGFFGDPFADAAAMMDAQMRRKTSQPS